MGKKYKPIFKNNINYDYKSFFLNERHLIKYINEAEFRNALDIVIDEARSDEHKYHYAIMYIMSFPSTRQNWGEQMLMEDLQAVINNMRVCKKIIVIKALNLLQDFVDQNIR